VADYGSVRHEVRLALVLNGGLSLAVWMGGVTNEIDLLRRASVHDPVAAGTAGSFWRRLCEKYNLRVTVDIIAGTSAGGLNGALLASAVAAGKPVPPTLRGLWIHDAALTRGKLLRRKEPPESLLSGEFLHDKIKEVTGEILSSKPIGDDPVTLFLTATALGGRDSTGVDSQGQAFKYEDHRRLYRFAYDPRRFRYTEQNGLQLAPENDFDPAGHEAIAIAARASAGFPLAFAPVTEKPLLDGDRYRVQPEAPASEQPSTYLIDGGVLDNAPFGPVVREICRRPVTGPYRRVLGYVVPSSGLPDMPMMPAAPGVPASPQWTSVISRAINMPREVDFRSDVDELSAALEAASESSIRRLYKRMRLDPAGRKALEQLALGLRREYRRARAVGGLWHVRHLMAHLPMGTALQVPPPVDPDRLLDDTACRWLPPLDAQLVLPAEGTWPWGYAIAEQAVLMLLRDAQEDLLAPQTPGAQPDAGSLNVLDVGALATDLSEALAKIHAIGHALDAEIRSRSAVLAASVSLDDVALAHDIDDIFQRLRVIPALSTVVRGAVRRYAEAVVRAERHPAHEPVPAEVVNERADEVMSWVLTAEVLSRSFATPTLGEPTAPMEFVRFGPDVDSLHPELKKLNGDGGQKLFGTKFGHFGGFARSDARERDWQWGRLDAAVHLTRLLLPADLDPQERDDWLLDAQTAVLADEAGPGAAADDVARELVAAAARADAMTDYQHLMELLKARGGEVGGKLDTSESVGSDTTAVMLADTALHLVTRARLKTDSREPVAWQVALEAALQREDRSRRAWRTSLLRWFVGGPRRALWQALNRAPDQIRQQLARATVTWVAQLSMLAAFVGALVATSVTALAYGDVLVAVLAMLVLIAGAAAIALRIWFIRRTD
jgi:predicted acylesterase/phospholipase RssA